MKNYIVLIFFLINQLSFSQGKEISTFVVKYQLDYIYNPENNNVKTEVMLLLINDNYSLFQGKNQRYNDSIVKFYKNSNLDEQSKYANMMSLREKTKFKYKIYKESNTIIYKEKPILNLYSYEERLNFKWEIQKETKQISNYFCQKATISFGGRNITAWFTKEIPINDGPYKFRGLPGLIIQLFDDKRHYVFNLLNVSKESLDMSFNIDETLKISKKEFYEDIKDFRKNRIQRMIQMGFKFRTEEQKNKFKERGKYFRANELELKIE